MEHVVFSAAQDGAGEEFRRVANLEEALRVVEHLRNDLGITDPTVFALTPVPVAFRTYYRVEVPAEAAEPERAETSLELAPVEFAPDEAAPDAGPAFDAVAVDDSEYLFDGNSDVEVPGVLPDASAIPASRKSDMDNSLGYFAR